MKIIFFLFQTLIQKRQWTFRFSTFLRLLALVLSWIRMTG